MNRKIKFQTIWIIPILAGILLGLIGCSKAADHSNREVLSVGSAAAPEYSYEGEIPMENGVTSESFDSFADTSLKNEPADSAGGAALPENRKLIQTVRMTVETNDLDTLMGTLNAQIGTLSGYVENQYVYNGSSYRGSRIRNAELTVRIPADSVSAFVDQVSGAANVISSNKSVDDVTLSYVATESRMNALKTEETRLLELLAQAETMDDLLTIESRLTDVRTELERVTSTLRVYDNQVDYATVYLTISEVTEYTVVEEAPATMGQRIASGFKSTLRDIGEGAEDFCVYVVVNLPYILFWAAVLTVVILLLRKRKKKKKQPEIQQPE